MPPVPNSIALSLLNDLLYCERRAGLKAIEGVRSTNEHTLLGDLVHEHVDLPGYEQRAGWTLLRALPVFSDRLGLSGKADLVEIRRESPRGPILEARPIEYKKGPKRKFDNDEVQLCAQALCLEEMFNIEIPSGAIYHAKSQRRREVLFDDLLRTKTLHAIDDLFALIAGGETPPAELKPQCDGCSLRDVCLPEADSCPRSHLFTPRSY